MGYVAARLGDTERAEALLDSVGQRFVKQERPSRWYAMESAMYIETQRLLDCLAGSLANRPETSEKPDQQKREGDTTEDLDGPGG